MRIVGGKFSGRKISAPPGIISRPTTDRVRESIFNLLESRNDIDFNEARVIDLFAGSGALGLEAMSRGAARCLFIEQDAVARGAIRENLETLGMVGQARVHRRSAISLGDRPSSDGGAFNIGFMDPPYDKNLAPTALASLRDGEWLAPDAVIVIEQAKKETPASAHGFDEIDRRKYGDTQIGIYQFNPDVA